MTISSARTPERVLINSAFAVYAVAALFLYDRLATSTVRSFPEPGGRIMLALVALGCGAVLTAAVRNDVRSITTLERPGHILLTWMYLGYGCWNVVINGLFAPSMVFTLVLLAMSGVSAWRLAEIRAFRREGKRVAG